MAYETNPPHATDPVRPHEPADDRSVGELVGELSGEMSQLVRSELELARLEMRESATRAARAGTLLGAGGFVVYLGVLLMAFAAAWGLAAVLPTGWAFLIVGVVLAAIGGVLLMVGRERMRRVDPVPEETLETLKEDGRWARAQVT